MSVKKEKGREKFSSGLAVFLATLSSAVGLGNIWLFPYVTGENGGAAFIFVYFICLLLIALPVLLIEFSIGRGTRKNIYGAIKKFTNKKIFRAIGFIGIISTSFILFFYTAVAGWVYSYIFKAISGLFNGMSAAEVSNVFVQTSSNPISAISWQVVAVIVACGILAFGVKGGIEKITKTLMPVLIGLLVFCVIRSLMLPGAMEGVEFLLKPDFSKINLGVVVAAMGLAFFKLCVGTGTMVTYSSYYTDDNNLVGTATKVALADTGVSILAGLAIFPAVFSFGLEPTSGPGLLFETIPLIFSGIPGGQILTVAFFTLTAMAATMAMISLFEVLTAALVEELKLDRVKAQVINAVVILSFGSLAALSGHSQAPLSHIKIFGNTFFDFYDKAVQLFMLPLNCILMCIFGIYFIKRQFFIDQLTNYGAIKNEKIAKIVLFTAKYITPVLIAIVFIGAFI
ncbi:sodium-dependent transporter [uncultured Clostridium sp.]|jgi:NSS family neurotransmitter:Na+ symporter|uniref:sodium-dependent transporter n=1 Tax=uncultured Clostridium sp. TaxID=59620 RepID=UPI0026192C5B|nr:sodium-dependent transporter [uncultured Clostridium sp.]